jgi:AcrR family transcriptional regulator
MDPGKVNPMPRTYTSSRRAQQAAQTRDDVVRAAIELFSTSGWNGTGLRAVAEHAGVAVETVYKAAGNKKSLLRAAMDAAVVGDTEPVPLADRPVMRTLERGTQSQRIAAAVRMIADIHERSAGVWLAIVEAASSDPEIDGWRRELEGRRRVEVGRAAELIFPGAVDEHLVTLLWLLYGPETYLKLVRDDGSRRKYESFLARATARVSPTSS